MPQNENQDRINNLGKDILTLSRNTLLVNLRFMDVALNQFRYQISDRTTYMINGEDFVYNPRHLLQTYKDEKEKPARDYLHMVMHCVYRHMIVPSSFETSVWDLACDISVENTITELGIRSITTKKEVMQENVISQMRDRVRILTAEKIYYSLIELDLSAEAIEKMREDFYVDEHALWYMNAEELMDKYSITLSFQEGLSGGSGEDYIDTEEKWIKISEQILQDLEVFSRERGSGAGHFVQNLSAINREKYDYESFLRKFASMAEVMKVNDEEFDYIYYTYGLSHYEKMPLIEPLEYKEVKRIKEFVLAIDTSGSVEGELVQKFIQKTYNILKSTETFSTSFNLHIIQCDTKIQESVKITSQRSFDEYIKSLTLKGFGGTDFRPVFDYVETLIKNKEFINLKGLIYFTDGYGIFPKLKPDYEVVFAFIDEFNSSLEVPPWAMKIVLQKEEI